MPRLSRLLPLLVFALAACAGGAAGNGASGTDVSRTRRASNVITTEELEEANFNGSVYDLVARLRPNYLRARGTDPVTGRQEFASVYVNGSRFGGLESLRQIGAADVREISFLIGPDAKMRFGVGHEGGAILVTLK